MSETDIHTLCKKYDIEYSNAYTLDTSYREFLLSFDTSRYYQEIKNHAQPLQVSYYDKTGNLVAFHVNCDVPKFTPTMKWNYYGEYDAFLPNTSTTEDSLIDLNDHLKYVHPINKDTITHFSHYDYTIIIHWNHWGKRHSKSLIKTVRQNLLLGKNLKTRILYVNNDSYLHYMFLKTEGHR